MATHTGFDTGEVLRGSHGALLSRLDFGVALFFVLSGFLLSRPFFAAAVEGRPAPSYPFYLWKRALRVLPLYWVTVVAALLLLDDNRGAGPGEWLRDLTLTQIYAGGLLSFGLTQMWSLCTEVAFYLLLPWVCAALLARRGPHAGRWVLGGLAALTAAGLAWQTVVAPRTNPVQEHLHQWLPGFLPWFCVGLLFAYVGVRQRHAAPRSSWLLLERWGHDLTGCWLVGGAAFALACTPLAGPRVLVTPTHWEAFAKVALYTVAAAFLVLPLVFGPEHEGRARQVLASALPSWLGEISYGVFCLHLLVLRGVMDVLDVPLFRGDFGIVLLGTVLGSVLLAALSHYTFERRLMRLRTVGPFAPATATARPSSASA